MAVNSRDPEEKYIIGIMSGTSADGINVAIIREAGAQLIYFSEQPMPLELREPILRLAEPGLSEIDTMGNLDRALGEAFGRSALATVEEAGISRSDILAIGSHGQTIRHRPKGFKGGRPFTLQIGCAATIAETTDITTVSDFRRRDIAADGEGAPLVPFAHHALFGSPDHPSAVLNIGGIANITFLHRNNIIGFDTGPGNMVMDALMLEMSDGRNRCDTDGDLAATGQICEPLLADLMQHPFLQRTPPKSTGREAFGREIVEKIMAWQNLSDADRIATATELTARAIAESTRFLPENPESWHVCGGGAYNQHLMSRLKKLLHPAPVHSTSEINVLPEAMEAISFALLARETLLGRPNTIPAVTGASHPVCGGTITPGGNWQDVMAWTHSLTH